MNSTGDQELMDLKQPEDGYRFSVDAFLLAAFVARAKPRHILDMGSGCGVVAWQVAQLVPEVRGVAVEIQDVFASFARENLINSGIDFVLSDIREYRHNGPPFDVLISNPPYFRPGHGKLSKNPVKAVARHSLNGDIVEWVHLVGRFLAEDGTVALVYPHRNCPGLVKCMEEIGFYLNEIVDVCSYAGQEPKLACLRFSRKAMPLEQTNLVLYHGHRVRTPAAVKFLEGTLQETNFL